MRTLITNGTIVTADGSYGADLLIDGETIAQLGRDLAAAGVEADETIDASGKYVIPGGIDVHTHMELPFGGTFAKDTFETGTRAAAFGGTTSIVDFAVQSKGQTLRQGLDAWHAKAEGNAVTDYGFHMIMSDVNDGTLAEMDGLVAEGVPDFKLFTAYPGVFYSDDGAIFRAMQQTARNGGLIMMHAENGMAIDVVAAQTVDAGTTDPIGHGLARKPIFEGEATNRVIRLAEAAEAPVYIVHLSARDALDTVRDARDRGSRVFAETCPQYLFMTGKDVDKPGIEGAKWMCSPPPRTEGDQEAIWQGLALGDLQVISSDHAPYAFDATGKLMAGPNPTFKQIANGMPGIEARLPVLFDAMVSKGRLGLQKFVEVTATAPAKIYNLHPRKGSIAIGADADVVVWDPKRQVKLADNMMHDGAHYTPYAGRTITGWPVTVMRRGDVIVSEGKLTAKPGSGAWVPRAGGPAAAPLGRLTADMDPARNFGAKLL
jgi:dihydropyrimidinase